ncbi:MAG: hypothetical protein IKW00_02970 [Clostridia bacterium]|nr:hypothetical protein [Clostridia bacterium]
MRTYIGLMGIGNAFGWGKRNAQGEYEVMLGGLRPHTVYTLGGEGQAESDGRGNIKTVIADMPLYIADEKGDVALYDAEVISYEEVRILSAPKAKIEVKEVQTTQMMPEKIPPVVYRTRLHISPVDALPRRIWPGGYEKLRTLMESGKPVRILPQPWRFTMIPGSGGICFAGYAAKHGRIVKTAYAVRAKGGLMQPKALQGYKYVRSEAGEGFWMYVQSVSASDAGCAR